MDTAEDFFRHLIERQPGLWGVVASDRDGVVLAEAFAEERPAGGVDPAFAASASQVLDQVNKMGLGANETVTALYDGLLVVHINHLPLVITLLASEDANAGTLVDLAADLKVKLAQMRNSILQE